MSVAGRRPGGGGAGSSGTTVELAILPSLKSCLVNLPASLVSLLLNANTVAQNVVVELQYRQAQPAGSDGKSKPAMTHSVFVGWTGMQSQSRPTPLIGREGVRSGSQDKDVATVEIDATFARRLGLNAGMKASVSLHVDPPQAHTVNIEPLTATDWEIIELHSSFLEMNFLSQVRALPNPAAGHTHPLTLHLTPTSTANILVTSLTPAPASTQSFVKISPDAEVIVAPKTRQSQKQSSSKDNRSTTSAGRRSAGGRSTTSQARHKSEREIEKSRPPIFLRGLTRALQSEWFEDGGDDLKDEGLRVWVDREHLLSKTLRGVTWVAVSIIKPAGLQEPVNPQSGPAPDQQPAQKVVAKLSAWEDAPDSRHVALSSLLCATLDAEDIVGGIVRIDPAPAPLPRTASALKDPSAQASKEAIVKKLRLTPFMQTQADQKAAGIKFGGESKAEKETTAQAVYKALSANKILEGPLTDGMYLPPSESWPGGILDFEPAPQGDPSRPKTNWLIGSERRLELVMQQMTVEQKGPQWPPGEKLPKTVPSMVGIDSVIEQTRKSLLHTSSVLLTGGLGAGKSSLVHLLAHQLRNEYLFNVIYFPCRTMVSDETRVKTIKDTLQRVFASASWGARIGGRSLVILDDLDKLCPVETELEQQSNVNSKQVSELLCSIVRQWCTRDSGVVMLATAQSKEAVNNTVIGGHVVRDIVAMKAPSKDGRRKVLDLLVKQASKAGSNDGAETVVKNGGQLNAWMEDSDGEQSRPASAHGADGAQQEEENPDLDLLEVAGQTDGYMPGDLAVLVSRARSEALMRAVNGDVISDEVLLTDVDFTAALKGFTPASLRGVTLHSSTTTFASIGGLKETRQTLLETLQYPTTYAPLFAKCPLRLRSGLLLYGYPGCGKTLLASAVAGECGLNFISVKGPEILNKYIGASEKSVRDLFERAEAAKPCVLFFDEFDAIAPKRGHDSTGVTDRVVNMLLTMMDGAEGLSGVYVLAATSRPDLIDPALLRPGRLDKSLICDMPAEDDRLDILQAIRSKLHLQPQLLDEDNEGPESLQEVARRTEGYSGADLQAVMYNAHLEAIHDVLGPSAESATLDSEKKSKSKAGGKSQDFSYFRLGQVNVSQDSSPVALAQQAAERAAIAEKLKALQLARRKAKAERQAARPAQQMRPGSAMSHRSSSTTLSNRPSSAHSHGHQTNGEKTPAASEEPVISWKHLEKSLQETRSSISKQEQMRLARIYKEFVVGRNGDMQDGSQGGTGVGGRTSLM
ncbi:putative AAA+ ATPase domain, ATPase, AAA-type, core, aspartate decarboxylase-like domain superfamily [Septoria linicola]|nr:putative AAA+ ATPase domain, ATPase, AAA-type, core, aspartate decarboxylase-like domain superfamily [Septoria linicola]